MNKRIHKIISIVLAFALVLTSGIVPAGAYAKTNKIALSSASVTIQKGSKKIIRVKNAKSSAKVKIKIKKSSIASAKITGKKIKITAKKAGSTTAVVNVIYKNSGKKIIKKLNLKIKVTNKSAATASPVASSSAPTVTASGAATVNPVVTVTPATTAAVKWDSTTNLDSESHTITVAASSDALGNVYYEKIETYDNGKMRKDLSSQYLIKNEMGEGINLGNVMEATLAAGGRLTATEATSFETAWGQPVTTEAMIKGLKQYGINTVRIPVAWTNMVSDDDDTYTINYKYLTRVEEIINYCLNNGMYVILNDHWDNGWWGQFGASAEWQAKAFARYESYWTQIANRYKDYSDHLIFESANEELGSRLNDGIYSNGLSTSADAIESATAATAGSLSSAECYEVLNKINQTFVDVVRGTGGNNTYRHLLIAGANTNIDDTVNSSFVMPKDTDDNANTKLSVSIHYYDPSIFTIAAKSCSWGYTDTWGTDEEKVYLHNQFDKMKKFTEAGYGVMIGEYGSCFTNKNGVAEYAYEVMNYAAQLGYLPVLWDTGMYYNKKTCQMDYSDIIEVFNEITGANASIPSDARKTGVSKFKLTSKDESELTSIWSWEGVWYKNDGKNMVGDGTANSERTTNVKSEDITKFVNTTSCTDLSKISFNTWGYQAYLDFDWDKIGSDAYIKITFANDGEDVVGPLMMASTNEVNGALVNETDFTYSDKWVNKCVRLNMDDLKAYGMLYLTFGYAPTITKIEIFKD